ncbi:flagellar basal body P-ring formation chaperone FlgA [Buchnera aphidicola]|uniref:flagellar basal body P-ring formation chaperone FlgA n=1 Tax=Buchnera aphidicola TaxID=9 RepID=UPI003463C239
MIDVLLTCDNITRHLNIELQVKGKYITANRFIPKGSCIIFSDLKTMTGRIDMLPYQTYFDKKDVINKVNLRDIFPLKPITSFMLRPMWMVTIHQRVNVIIKGVNFKIISHGTALKNASKNQLVPVKIYNNCILSGIVNSNGDVIIHM